MHPYYCIITMDNCPVCLKKLQNHSRRFTCNSCHLMYHVKCITLSSEHAEYIKENIGTWFCEQCNTSLFPFNHIENELDFICCVEDWPNHNKMSLSYLSDKLFLPFELNDSDHSILSDTDPDLHFYNGMSQYVTQCNYYLEPYFNEHIANKVAITNSKFSLCHGNIRSIRKNLSELESYLEVSDHEFSIIGLTETWLNDSSWNLWYKWLQYCWKT